MTDRRLGRLFSEVADGLAALVNQVAACKAAGKLSGRDAELVDESIGILRDILRDAEEPVAILDHDAVVNFMAGLESAEPKQREGFEAVGALIGDRAFKDVLPVLGALRHAKRKAGRCKGSGFRSDGALLQKMKVLVGRGSSIPRAARKLAREARIGGTLESTAKRLERKYRLGEK